jgi:hypothetical protein
MFVKNYLPFLCLVEGDGAAGSGGQGGSQNGGQGSGSGQQGSGSGQGGSSSGTGQNSGQQGGQAGSGGQNGQGAQSANKVEDLPDWAQKLIRDTREEAADNRTKKNTAEQSFNDLVSKIGQAFGLTGTDAKDPEKLAQDLTTERQRSRESAVKLAVYQAAGEHDADPAALLDSQSFLSTLNDLDPAADDFGSRVGTRIADAVSKNARLKAATPGGTANGGRDMGQGRQGSQSGPTGVAAGRALRQARKGSRSKQTT